MNERKIDEIGGIRTRNLAQFCLNHFHIYFFYLVVSIKLFDRTYR